MGMILRGGKQPNYDSVNVFLLLNKNWQKLKLPASLVVDSHGNSE